MSRDAKIKAVLKEYEYSAEDIKTLLPLITPNEALKLDPSTLQITFDKGDARRQWTAKIKKIHEKVINGVRWIYADHDLHPYAPTCGYSGWAGHWLDVPCFETLA